MRIDPNTLSPGRRYFLMISCIIPRPIAWVGTLNEDAPLPNGLEGIGHRAFGVVVRVNAQGNTGESVMNGADCFSHLVWKRTSVGIAKGQVVGAGVLGRLKGGQGVGGVGAMAVKEMLRVKDHFLPLGFEKTHRIGDHDQILVQGRSKGMSHLEIPGFSENADDRGLHSQ